MTHAVVGCVLLLAAAAEPFNEAARKELKALEGDWVVVRVEADGKKQEPDAGERVVLTIKGTKWTFAATGEEGEIVSLDPTTDPKLIDMKDTRKDRARRVIEEVYKVDGDTLMLCGYPGKEVKRPTGFDTAKEPGTVLFVFKRLKP